MLFRIYQYILCFYILVTILSIYNAFTSYIKLYCAFVIVRNWTIAAYSNIYVFPWPLVCGFLLKLWLRSEYVWTHLPMYMVRVSLENRLLAWVVRSPFWMWTVYCTLALLDEAQGLTILGKLITSRLCCGDMVLCVSYVPMDEYICDIYLYFPSLKLHFIYFCNLSSLYSWYESSIFIRYNFLSQVGSFSLIMIPLIFFSF